MVHLIPVTNKQKQDFWFPFDIFLEISHDSVLISSLNVKGVDPVGFLPVHSHPCRQHCHHVQPGGHPQLPCLCWKGGSFQVGGFSHFHALLHFLFLPVITRQISWPVLVHLVWSSRVLCGSQPERLPTWQAGACSYLCQSSIGPYSSSGGYMPWLQARLEWNELLSGGIC